MSDRAIMCFDCTEIRDSALSLEQASTSPGVSRNGVRSEFSGETVQELIPQIYRAFPDMCEYCAYLIARILTLPVDSIERNEAWDTFHTLGRGR